MHAANGGSLEGRRRDFGACRAARLPAEGHIDGRRATFVLSARLDRHRSPPEGRSSRRCGPAHLAELELLLEDFVEVACLGFDEELDFDPPTTSSIRASRLLLFRAGVDWGSACRFLAELCASFADACDELERPLSCGRRALTSPPALQEPGHRSSRRLSGSSGSMSTTAACSDSSAGSASTGVGATAEEP